MYFVHSLNPVVGPGLRSSVDSSLQDVAGRRFHAGFHGSLGFVVTGIYRLARSLR